MYKEIAHILILNEIKFDKYFYKNFLGELSGPHFFTGYKPYPLLIPFNKFHNEKFTSYFS